MFTRLYQSMHYYADTSSKNVNITLNNLLKVQ